MALQIDFRYVFAFPHGVLRLLAIVFSLVILICIWALSYLFAFTWWIELTGYLSLITVSIFLIAHILHLPTTGFCANLPWSFLEFWNCAVLAVFYFVAFITSCVNASKSYNYEWLYQTNPGIAYIFLAIFTVLNLLIVAYLARLFYPFWRCSTTTTRAATVTTSHTTTTVRY